MQKNYNPNSFSNNEGTGNEVLPKYYDKQIKIPVGPEAFEAIKLARKKVELTQDNLQFDDFDDDFDIDAMHNLQTFDSESRFDTQDPQVAKAKPETKHTKLSDKISKKLSKQFNPSKINPNDTPASSKILELQHRMNQKETDQNIAQIQNAGKSKISAFRDRLLVLNPELARLTLNEDLDKFFEGQDL